MEGTGSNPESTVTRAHTALLSLLFACGDAAEDTTWTDAGAAPSGAEHDAFSTHVTITTDGDEVTFETNGLPDHTSPYWSPDHELYVEATVAEGLAPGYIDDFDGSYTLTVPASPALASSSSATSLGPIGIAVSGAMIYDDQEGQNVPLDDAVGSLDYTGGHTGPASYHYHLEPVAWTEDDDALVGIMSDGFYIYGRRCASTGGHPEDLDSSGGHVAATQHTAEAHYHYHIVDEVYLSQYYLIFSGDLQGSPTSIQ